MWFWWLLFCFDLLIPALMMVCGWMMWKHCPKKINGWIGYRTARSMKNMDTWRFAHEYCGKLWWKTGWMVLIPSAVVPIPFYGAKDSTIGAVAAMLETAQIFILLASLLPTERALKRNFTDDGNRK